jgi:tetratricopeptide (TPR) repeat protein
VTTSFAEYLRLYEECWSRLQETSPKLNSYEDRSLYTTWKVTIDRIEKQNAASAQLLKLWAYFDKQDLWFGLLQPAHATNDEWIQKLTRDELDFNKAVRLLCEYGLAYPDTLSGQLFGYAGYSVHSCVHSWTISVLNDRWDNELSRLALTCVASAIPSTNTDKWWLLQRRLLQHAEKHEHSITGGTVDITRIEWTLHKLGNLYRDQDKLADAEKMYKRALRAKEEALGPDHTSTLVTVNNLANLYRDQGKLAEAELRYKRALRGNEKALGPDHTSTLTVVNNLGLLYARQGRVVKADKMYVWALRGREEALGPDHTATLMTLNNLGNLYRDQGKLAEAEVLYKRALRGKVNALGPDHTSTMTTVNNLGLLYARQGRVVEADKMYVWALRGREEALGPDHTSTLKTVNDLGNLYVDQGMLAEAEKMYKRAFYGYKRTLGDGPAFSYLPALKTLETLAELYEKQGRTAEALAILATTIQGLHQA